MKFRNPVDQRAIWFALLNPLMTSLLYKKDTTLFVYLPSKNVSAPVAMAFAKPNANHDLPIPRGAKTIPKLDEGMKVETRNFFGGISEWRSALAVIK